VEVVGAVLGNEGTDFESVLETGVDGAIAAEGEAVAQLGEPDENERQEWP
jgi:hypothetical protein